MAQATVKTVQYLDPRIEPQPDPVYDYVIGPTQNQYYRIPSSGLSNSQINFNNLTTLGIDRAYLDTFEIEIDATITFNTSQRLTDANRVAVTPDMWTFQSFPFNSCCDEARININGGAFFSQPMSYVRAKERYMNQMELAKSYQNICPYVKPQCQTESGRIYAPGANYNEARTHQGFLHGMIPTRLGKSIEHFGNAPNPVTGNIGNWNNGIIDLGEWKSYGTWDHDSGDGDAYMYENYHDKYTIAGGILTKGAGTVVNVRWREPVFCSPFSSRYDATYGRPLYNITSMDLSFTMPNLGNMIRVARLYSTEHRPIIENYNITINAAWLCYQVMTIPPVLNKPLTTLVPYRRFVPYITDYNPNLTSAADAGQIVPPEGATIKMSSGVYTLNEVPTAIWVFVAPNKADYQTNDPDYLTITQGQQIANLIDTHPVAGAGVGNWETNRLFGFIKSINISLANTTQILATAKLHDLYRIAKANGCEDNFWSWAGNNTCTPTTFANGQAATASQATNVVHEYNELGVSCYGAGSVLRLIPGVDLIVPDQPLIPGANANNMVFQVSEVEAYIPPHARSHSKYALWLLFEYVGVAAISPGQCEITMNPLGSGEIMAVSPVMSATSDTTEGNLEGSGFWDKLKKGTRIASQLADEGIISKILKHIPGAEGAAKWAHSHGLGEPAAKRSRGGACAGGAVIGKGLNDWV